MGGPYARARTRAGAWARRRARKPGRQRARALYGGQNGPGRAIVARVILSQQGN